MPTYGRLFSDPHQKPAQFKLTVYPNNQYDGKMDVPSEGFSRQMRNGLFENSSYTSYEMTEVFTPDPNMDALALLEYRLQEMEVLFLKKLNYWKKKKADILAASGLEDDAITRVQNHGAKELFKRILREIKSLIQFPESNLRDVFERVSPHMIAVGENLHNNCQHLLDADNHTISIKNKDQLRLSICNDAIDTITDFIGLINNVSREIKFCLKCEEVVERAVTFMLEFAFTWFSTVALPSFDFHFGMSDLYRKFLFNNVRKETDRIESFIAGSEGAVERADTVLEKEEKQAENPKLEPMEVEEDNTITTTPSDKKQTLIDQFFQKQLRKETPVDNNTYIPTSAPSMSV